MLPNSLSMKVYIQKLKCIHCKGCRNPQECFQAREICSLSAILSTVNPVYSKNNMGVTWNGGTPSSPTPFSSKHHGNIKLHKVFYELLYSLTKISLEEIQDKKQNENIQYCALSSRPIYNI